VRALGRVARYAAWRREPIGTPPPMSTVGVRPPATPVEVLLAAYGIDVVPSTLASHEDVVEAAAAYGQPVALKVAGTAWRHRVDLGAVRLNLATPTQVFEAYEELERLFGEGVEVVVQPMVAPGVACVVEAMEDRAFGPVIGFGLAGPATDLLDDRAWRAAPLTDLDAAALLREPRASPLLRGYRGAEPLSVSALEEVVTRLSALVEDHPEIAEADLNPVLVGRDDATVVDARIRVEQAPPRRPWPSVGA
jgi:acyl-CoA synthetase (NDP forming)